jgi:hypothetical protein
MGVLVRERCLASFPQAEEGFVEWVPTIFRHGRTRPDRTTSGTISIELDERMGDRSKSIYETSVRLCGIESSVRLSSRFARVLGDLLQLRLGDFPAGNYDNDALTFLSFGH